MTVSTFVLPAPPGFSLKACVLSHGWHECLPFFWSEGGRCFETVERLGDRILRVSVMQEPGRTSARLRVGLHADVSACGAEKILSDRLGRSLGLQRDLTEFHELCRSHRALKPIPQIGGGRLTRSPSMTENIIKMLCSTNVNWTQAVKMINRIAQLGPHVPHFRNLTAWPTPKEILRAGATYLDKVCRLGYRTESILKFCRDADSGRFDADGLDALAGDPSVSSADLLALLLSIRGVGPATAHSLLGFLGRHDRLSIDSATLAHVARTHNQGRKPTAKFVERVYAPYGKWKNLVYWCEHWLTWDTAKKIVAESDSKR